ncbi:hypothetical protein KY317_02610 [Candidatus Woesearchaeota archaeon]|nr:hypothetical protein [Candidatus Woesearchaeota archaeon]
MKGKKAMLIADWADFMILVVIGFFMFLIIGIVFAGPVISEKSESSADLTRLNGHYNLNQFLKTEFAENNGKSIAESMVDAYENDNWDLAKVIGQYARNYFETCYPQGEGAIAWQVYILGNEYLDNPLENMNSAKFKIGGQNCLFGQSWSHFYTAHLPTSNPDNPIMVIFGECLGKYRGPPAC